MHIENSQKIFSGCGEILDDPFSTNGRDILGFNQKNPVLNRVF
jgi:hypothetical protein